MNLKQKKAVQLVSLALLLSTTSIATADFGISAGVGKLNDYKKLDHDISLLLGLEYRGEKFNMDSSGLSYDFTNSNDYAVEAFLTSKNLGFEAGDGKAFKGMDKRSTSVDVGGRIIMKTGVGPLVMDVTKDVHNSHGYEAGIKIGGIAPHAPHWTGNREVKIAPAAGLRYQSKNTVDYFYGVKNSEATASRKAYKGKGALTPYLGVEAQANITKHITINGGLGFTKRANAIRNSPLTSDSKYQGIANIGFTYWF